MNRTAIQARRDALAAQHASAQEQHTEWQKMIGLLEHNISAMQGGLQELDALLALPDAPALHEALDSAAAWEEVARNYQDAP